MKKLCISLLLACFSVAGATNKDATLMTIGNKEISLGEFEYLYNKNKQIVNDDNNSLEDYVDLFTNFKLKVIEAQELGYDTVPKFVKELSGYRNQLSKPYLKDQDLDQKLIQEAYNRLIEEVEASHILIMLDGNAKDTTAAYTKALKAYNEILAGKSFTDVAKKYSDDPSVAQNGGYLGYFSGFQMVFPFEDAAYKTAVGEISQPIRTRFGYHIVKVSDRRPASGEINISHILIQSDENMGIVEKEVKKETAFEVYSKLKDGQDFAKLAQKYSEDYGSASNGGNIGFIRRGQTIPIFENKAFDLKEDGDISEPVLTRFGWHIIRLNSRKAIPSFEEKKADIKLRLAKDERGTKPEEIFLAKLKKEYNYSINEAKLQEIYAIDFDSMNSTSKADKTASLQDIIITYGNESKTQKEFIEYAQKNSNIGTNFETLFQGFEKQTLINYEKSRLEYKYDDFKYLINEYHDGLLLFEISNKMIWEKASKDQKGLEKFYKKNKKNYTFTEPCFGGEIIYLKDSSALAQYDSLKENLSIEEVKDSMNTKTTQIKIEKGFYSVGKNDAIDKQIFGKDIETDNSEFEFNFVTGKQYEKGDIKPLKATRGICISDYQKELEGKWIKQLRKKYKVVIDENILKSIQ